MAEGGTRSQASATAGPVRLPVGVLRRHPSTVLVLAGVGSLLALLAVAAVVAIVLVVSIRDATNVAGRHVEYINAIHLAALHAKSIANHERGYLISGRGEFRREIEVDTEKARAEFLAAEREATSNAQLRAVYQSSTGFERWLDEIQQEVAMFQRGDRRRAVEASLGPTRALRKEYEASLDKAHALGTSRIEAATSSVSDQAWRSVRILLVYLVFALAASVVITVWLVRTMLKPV